MKSPPETIARRRLAVGARSAREKRRLTQEDAAEVVGCSVQQIRRIERAKANATIDLIARLAAAYKVDLKVLFSSTGRWKKRPVGRPRALQNGKARTTPPVE